jgi:hypothetical protein
MDKASKAKTVKMRFGADQYYPQAENGSIKSGLDKPLYEKGKVYDVEESMSARWLKRGGEIVTDELLEQEKKEDKKIEKQLDEGLKQ